MKNGYLSIILHAHLPYVHHPEYASFFEENWLFEANTECYLPLIAMLDRLQAQNIDYRLTLSLSPTLLSMWADPLLQERYLQQLQNQLALAEKEIHRNRQHAEQLALAEMYAESFRLTLCSYRDHYQCNLLSAFIKHQQTGKLELLTTAATHGFLPLLNISETAVRNQIRTGIATFRHFIGSQPQGLWLPECGYYPGLEKILAEFGIRYFFVDSHGIMQAEQLPEYGVYAPLDCGNGVLAFGRDPACSKQVWSAEEGYPGDADYREYYSDIGFELELDYLGDIFPDGNTRMNTGFKYQRITGKQLPKQCYQRQAALAKADLHARHFIAQRQAQIDALSMDMPERVPMIIAPYDAELFGHWWYEGPSWLESVLSLASQPDNGVQTFTCSEYLDLQLTPQIALPSASSWGDHGYSSYWLNESNDWIYPLIHKAESELEKLIFDLKKLAVNDLQRRALNQAVRSVLLAQASDWAFILKAGTTVEYAKKRVFDHLARFNYLHDAIRKNRINERYLTALEIMDEIFPNLDYRECVT